MHLAWTEFAEHEKIAFLEIQRLFSQEHFQPHGIRLERVALRCYPGFHLVRARIFPQTVQLSDGRAIDVTEEMQSYFLYNRDSADLRRKIVPLTQKAISVHQFNYVIGLKLDDTMVVDYVKFFGLTIHDELFYFVTHVQEIPWRVDTDAREREKLLAKLSVFTPISDDGHIDTDIRVVKVLPLDQRLPSQGAGYTRWEMLRDQHISSSRRLGQNG